jgi:hypothetical protein
MPRWQRLVTWLEEGGLWEALQGLQSLHQQVGTEVLTQNDSKHLTASSGLAQGIYAANKCELLVLTLGKS